MLFASFGQVSRLMCLLFMTSGFPLQGHGDCQARHQCPQQQDIRATTLHCISDIKKVIVFRYGFYSLPPPPLPTTVCGHALSDTYVEARLGFYICFKLANVMRMQCSIVAFASGKTALMVASSQANVEAMRVLLAAGAGDLWYKHSTKSRESRRQATVSTV